MTLPLSFLAVHFIADFLLQNDWMALNKSKRWDALALHVTIYSVSFALLVSIVSSLQHGGPNSTYTWTFIDPDYMLALKFGGLTWVTHFLTDAVTSRWTSKLWFLRMIPKTAQEKAVPVIIEDEEYLVTHGPNYTYLNYHADLIPGRRHWFFAVIGLDQFIHAATLAWTLRFLS